MSRTTKPADNNPDACWIYDGAIASGYGRIRVDGDLRQVTHVMHEMFKGPVAHGLQVCHTCDVRNCINPKHLWVGTRSENMIDCRDKGRLTAMNEEWKDKRRKLNSQHVDIVKRFISQGLSMRAIALRLRLPHSNVSDFCRRYRIQTNGRHVKHERRPA